MSILSIVGILVSAYVVNAALVVCFGFRPYWTIFVPGLPLVLVAFRGLLYALAIVAAAVIGAVYGTALGVAICIVAVRELPLLEKPERTPMPEADVVPRLELT